MEDTEWGEWINHDGKGHPRKGTICEYEFPYACRMIGSKVLLKTNIGPVSGGGSWFYGCASDKTTWSKTRCGSIAVPIIRYRIKKPRGLAILEKLIQDLPAEIKDRVNS